MVTREQKRNVSLLFFFFFFSVLHDLCTLAHALPSLIYSAFYPTLPRALSLILFLLLRCFYLQHTRVMYVGVCGCVLYLATFVPSSSRSLMH